MVDRQISKAQADHLFKQSQILRAEQIQLAAHIFDVPFEQQDAFVVAESIGFEFVQVEPFEQTPMNSQFQISHDRTKVSFQFGAADRRGLFRFECQRERSDSDRFSGGEVDALATDHFGVADHATIDADVFELQLSVVTSDDRLPL